MSNATLQILVKRTKLFFDDQGDAPANTSEVFNILENFQFYKRHGHLSYDTLPLAALKHKAQLLLDDWNVSQPKNWRYEFA
jgi:hypothetical protein